MSIASRKLTLVGAAASVAVSALLLAGCAAAPSTSTPSTSSSSSASSTAAASSYLPCVVGDTGGFADHSFNQLALGGVTEAASKLGTSYKKVQAVTSNDYASSISSLIGEKCNIIVAPGFNFVATVKASATANPKVDYAMIDDNSINLPNVRDVVYETDQAAFLGGYAAAAYSKTGVIATWGGAEYPSVTIYMDGIYDGVQYYNQQHNAHVQVLGWNEKTQKGTFVGNFTSQTTAKQDTLNFLSQHADVIVPVAGSLYQGAAAAIQSSGSSAVLVGVDSDIFESDPTYGKYFLTSVLKNLQPTVATVVEQAASGSKFVNTTYIGTLKNGGVGLAPFHDFASKIPSTLSSELSTIQTGIINGTIKVASPVTF